MQTLAAQLGGSTEAADQREFGHAQVERIGEDRLLGGLYDQPGHERSDGWMSHGDHVVSAPPGYVVTARTERITVEALAHTARRGAGGQGTPDSNQPNKGQDAGDRAHGGKGRK